jgi:hypothetical protein
VSRQLCHSFGYVGAPLSAPTQRAESVIAIDLRSGLRARNCLPS